MRVFVLVLLFTFSSCLTAEEDVVYCDCTEVMYYLDKIATVTELEGCYSDFEIQDFNYLDGRIKRITCK